MLKLSKIKPPLYWGPGTVPAGAEIIGTIQRDGGPIGALIRLSNGNYVQGNSGAFRTLPKAAVEKLLVGTAQ
jgi:hypothetical protein